MLVAFILHMPRSIIVSTIGPITLVIVCLNTFSSSYEVGLIFGSVIMVLSDAPLTLLLRDECDDLIDGRRGVS